MDVEFRMLLWSIALGVVQITIALGAATAGRGVGWALGPRDGPDTAPSRLAGRLDRARGNFLETFAFFAALVLMVELLHRQSALTATAVQLYFWARLAYVPVYAAGIPYLRTLVWAVSVVGIALLWFALF